MTPEKRAKGFIKAVLGEGEFPLSTQGLLNHFRDIEREAKREAALAERARCVRRVEALAKHFEADNDREAAAMVRDCAAAIEAGEATEVRGVGIEQAALAERARCARIARSQHFHVVTQDQVDVAKAVVARIAAAIEKDTSFSVEAGMETEFLVDKEGK